MRKRKLYLSELLKRYVYKEHAVFFTEHYYDSVLECLQNIQESETYWNAEVEEWLLTTMTFNNKRHKVLIVKLK